MDIVRSTRSYEQWLAEQTAVVRPDLRYKHERMSESAFVFLRGTFYRWTQVWPEVCASLVNAPTLPSVGDLHIENFGTWRDGEGRLVWGVNDVDESCELPYTNDLVRLATSAVLATRHGHFDLVVRDACEAILEGYTLSLERGGAPLVLEERRQWLRQIALNELRSPKLFWQRLEDAAAATGDIPEAVLKAALPATRLPHRVLRRVAGVGSLGRPRFVALAEWQGAWIAREAKARVASALVWATGRTSGEVDGATLLARAVRAIDPFFTIKGGWIVRRLAPDCSRIELTDLPRWREEDRLLRAMGFETANVHLGRRRLGVRSDLQGRPRRWLEAAAVSMADVVEAEWRDWKKRAG